MHFKFQHALSNTRDGAARLGFKEADTSEELVLVNIDSEAWMTKLIFFETRRGNVENRSARVFFNLFLSVVLFP